MIQAILREEIDFGIVMVLCEKEGQTAKQIYEKVKTRITQQISYHRVYELLLAFPH
ncbi:hypothetical protein HYW21_06140 [Candidatus Woesearchaeota archaeon]|nr:hypothetical protein [Candidatus Woesearchaeota archaeon]